LDADAATIRILEQRRSRKRTVVLKRSEGVTLAASIDQLETAVSADEAKRRRWLRPCIVSRPAIVGDEPVSLDDVIDLQDALVRYAERPGTFCGEITMAETLCTQGSCGALLAGRKSRTSVLFSTATRTEAGYTLDVFRLARTKRKPKQVLSYTAEDLAGVLAQIEADLPAQLPRRITAVPFTMRSDEESNSDAVESGTATVASVPMAVSTPDSVGKKGDAPQPIKKTASNTAKREPSSASPGETTEHAANPKAAVLPNTIGQRVGGSTEKKAENEQERSLLFSAGLMYSTGRLGLHFQGFEWVSQNNIRFVGMSLGVAGDGSAFTRSVGAFQEGDLGDENLESGDYTAFIGVAGLGLVKQVAGVDLSLTVYPIGTIIYYRRDATDLPEDFLSSSEAERRELYDYRRYTHYAVVPTELSAKKSFKNGAFAEISALFPLGLHTARDVVGAYANSEDGPGFVVGSMKIGYAL
jgi:hypothetical protein